MSENGWTTIKRGWEWQHGKYRVRRIGLYGSFCSINKQDRWGNWLSVVVVGNRTTATMMVSDLEIRDS